MNAVLSGVFPVRSMDDHSDVVRLCVRPAWLKLAWASARDYCLARFVRAHRIVRVASCFFTLHCYISLVTVWIYLHVMNI